MSKASINLNCVSTLAQEIASRWRHSRDSQAPGYRLDDGLSAIALALCSATIDIPIDSGRTGSSQAAAHGLDAALIVRLRQGADAFVNLHKQRLLDQGLERVTEAGLRAFFFSALYENLRFETTLGEGDEPVNGGGRRQRKKRRGAAYFTPPALAYLAAYRALSVYFEADDPPLPLICDPAMGSGLYLVAALDYLSAERPAQSRISLAKHCLFGQDFDAITCSAARNCLMLAVHSSLDGLSEASEFDCNLRWDDAMLAQLPPFDIVLSNPPWDIVKAAKTSAGLSIPSRVNKARSAALRQTFNHQGEGDTSYYKLFLERAHQILKPGGVAAVLTPAAFCGDKGAAPLRALIMDSCNWLSLDGFINEDNAFAIHPHFKFVLLGFKKGGVTEAIKTRFGLVADRSRLADTIGDTRQCSQSEPEQFLYEPSLVKLLGGPTRAILELGGQSDLQLLTALYQRHTSLKMFVDGRAAFFRREFDMTLDRRRFITIKRAGQLHLRQGAGGHFVSAIEGEGAEVTESYLPLFEGRMIGQFEAGKQTAASRYLVKASDYRRRVPELCAKVGFVSITSPFNTRSMIASYLPDLPAGNSVPTLVFELRQNDFLAPLEDALYTTAIFNSFVFDAMVRLRLAGNNLSYHLLEALPFPPPDSLEPHLKELTVALSALLSLSRGHFSAELSALVGAQRRLYKQAMMANLARGDCAGGGADDSESDSKDDDFCLAISAQEMLRFRLWLEVLVCEIYGLTSAQVDYILRDCKVSAEALRLRRRLNKGAINHGSIEVRGAAGPGSGPEIAGEPERNPCQRSFFRVDKGLAPHLRLSNLVSRAFAHLKSGQFDYAQGLFEAVRGGDLSLALPPLVEESLLERFATLAPDPEPGSLMSFV